MPKPRISSCASLFEQRGDTWNTPNFQGPQFHPFSSSPKSHSGGLVRDPGYDVGLPPGFWPPKRAEKREPPPEKRRPRDPRLRLAYIAIQRNQRRVALGVVDDDE